MVKTCMANIFILLIFSKPIIISRGGPSFSRRLGPDEWKKLCSVDRASFSGPKQAVACGLGFFFLGHD
jgi:hypothetical protein